MGGAGQCPAVRARARVPAGMAGQRTAGRVLAPGVDWAERWCGQGDERGRVCGDSAGYAFAADEARADELVGVGPVGLGAGREVRARGLSFRITERVLAVCQSATLRSGSGSRLGASEAVMQQPAKVLVIGPDPPDRASQRSPPRKDWDTPP